MKNAHESGSSKLEECECLSRRFRALDPFTFIFYFRTLQRINSYIYIDKIVSAL